MTIIDALREAAWYFFGMTGCLFWIGVFWGVVFILLVDRRIKREHRAFYAEWQKKAVKEADLIVRKR